MNSRLRSTQFTPFINVQRRVLFARQLQTGDRLIRVKIRISWPQDIRTISLSIIDRLWSLRRWFKALLQSIANRYRRHHLHTEERTKTCNFHSINFSAPHAEFIQLHCFNSFKWISLVRNVAFEGESDASNARAFGLWAFSTTAHSHSDNCNWIENKTADQINERIVDNKRL